MAGSTLDTIQAILKEDYQGAVRDQLHREVRLLQLFKKGKTTWQGKRFVVALRTGGQSGGASGGIGFRKEGAALPTAENQTFTRILNKAKFLYGSFEIGGPDIAASSNGGSMALANTLHDEMKFLVEDIKNFCDKVMYSGGQTRGLIATTGDDIAMNAQDTSVQLTVGYTGSFDYFPKNKNATPADWVRVKLVRLNDYNDITDQTGVGVFVSDYDEEALTITLQGQDSGAAPASFVFTTGGTGVGGVPDGVGCALLLHDTQYADSTGAPVGTFKFKHPTNNYDADNEFSGILDNLCNPVHHEIDRKDGALNGGAELQSTVLTMSGTAVAAATASSAWGTISPERIQKGLDIVRTISHRGVDVWLTNPMTRHKYIALTTVSDNVRVGGKMGGLDYGADTNDLGFGGVGIQIDSNCPKSMLIGLHLSSWSVYELKGGDFDDTDGKILHQKAGFDRYEGFWKWYLQLVCEFPRRNLIMYGFSV